MKSFLILILISSGAHASTDWTLALQTADQNTVCQEAREMCDHAESLAETGDQKAAEYFWETAYQMSKYAAQVDNITDPNISEDYCW